MLLMVMLVATMVGAPAVNVPVAAPARVEQATPRSDPTKTRRTIFTVALHRAARSMGRGAGAPGEQVVGLPLEGESSALRVQFTSRGKSTAQRSILRGDVACLDEPVALRAHELVDAASH